MKKINKFLSLLLILPMNYVNGSEIIKQKRPRMSASYRKVTTDSTKDSTNIKRTYGIQVPYKSISKSKYWTQIKNLSSGITDITGEDIIIDFSSKYNASIANNLLNNSLKTEPDLWKGYSAGQSGVRISVPPEKSAKLKQILDMNSTFKELIFPTNLGENNLVVNVNAPEVSKNVLQSLKGLVRVLASGE